MKKPYWRNESLWICPKHLPAVRVPAHIERCWFSGCPSERPANRPGQKNSGNMGNSQQRLCAWFKCDKGPNGTRAIVRKNSKYCSRDCSNRNARWRHKQRLKKK